MRHKRTQILRTVFVLAAVFLAAASRLWAYSFMPLVTNYTSHEPMCATQAWAATQDSSGTLFFATSDGVLAFDGLRWEVVPVDGSMVVRSVRAVGDRVYVGAFEQFGYIERDEYGAFIFHSLKDMTRNYAFKDDEFWTIVPHDDRVYFQSFRSIFDFDGQSIGTYQEDSHRPLYLFRSHGRLFVQEMGSGLAGFDGEDFLPAIGRDVCGSDVVAMLDQPDGITVLCTESNGLFLFDHKRRKVEPVATEIDRELCTSIVNRACMMSDGTIAIGTIRNGVFAIDSKGKLRWHYNLDNGLGNNCILGLTEDSSGNLWVMMDHGISLIHSGLPYSFLMPHSGEPYIGMTYDIFRSDDRLYIGTNQGLYFYSDKDMIIRDNGIEQSQIWHIDAFDGQLFVGGGNLSMNLCRGSDPVFLRQSSTDIKKGTIHGHEVLVESSYYALRIYRRSQDGLWTFSHEIEGFGAPIRQIEIDSDGSLWCGHIARGVLRLELAPDLRTVRKIEKIIKASPRSVRPASFVMKLRGRIAVSDGDSLYTYDSRTASMSVMADFHADLPSMQNIVGITALDDNRFWVSTRNSYVLVSYRKGHYSRLLSIPLDFTPIQSNGVNNKVHIDRDQNCYFAINNGVGRISQFDIPSATAGGHISIASVESLGPDGDRRRLRLRPSDDGPEEVSGNITVNLRYPAYNLGTPRFIYRLEGPQKRVTVTDRPSMSYSGLGHGRYTLKASMLDDDNKEVETEEFQFVVPTPAHLTWWAMAGYAMGLLCLIVLISKLYSRRQVNIQRRQNEIERTAQNVKILEQERIISEQQKRLLENELSEKSKELASMALEVGYKHQVIENLRESISAQRRKGMMVSGEMDTLIKAINSDIGNNEFWEIFHNNFDLIHENFFRNLRKQFPSLTPIDMKFCALLRLNMSTKDIAQFTHLTVRGVETARYRLRRRLGLDSKDSIVQFLIDFK